MILPVEERQGRPCYTIEPNGEPEVVCCFCEFAHEAEYGGDDEEYLGEKHIPRCSRTKETWPTPCKYHITLEEVAELVDSKNDNELSDGETHNPVKLSHFLKIWYEQDVRYINWLLEGLEPGTDRYDRLMRERRYRVNALNGAV